VNVGERHPCGNETGVETVVVGLGGKAKHVREGNISVVDMEKAVGFVRKIFGESNV
jgi:hypothetical protein